MEINITERSGTGFTQVRITHNGENIYWVTKFFSKVNVTNVNDVFAGINGFVATLPEEVQNEIFELYREMKEIIDETKDGFDILVPLRGCIRDLYQFIHIESFQRWILGNYNMYIPELQESVEESDRYNNRDETYIRADYVDLVIFSMLIRFMIPVWGEYIARGGAGHGNDLYKEVDAYNLIQGLDFMDWPVNNGTPGSLPVRDKLLRYIEIKASRTSITLSDLVLGFGTPDIPVRLLATVILRRLTNVPLSISPGEMEGKNIVANIHHYVDQRLKPQDKRAGAVNPKMKENEGGDEDDKTSVFEQYKIRQQVCDGDIIAYEEDAFNVEKLALKVDPTIDLNLLKMTSSVVRDLDNILASKHQILLAQWCLAKAFPARAFDDISLKAVNHLLVTAQALYLHWGFPDIAILLTVSKLSTGSTITQNITPLPKPTSRFKPEVLTLFMRLYPHFFPQSGKDAKDVKGNVALIGISTGLQDIFEAIWVYRGHPEVFKRSNQEQGQRTIFVQTSIRQSLVEAVEKIVSLNQ